MNPAAQLARCPLFRGFTGTGLQILASIAHERTLEAGTHLFREGEPADSLFVVVEGTLSVRITGEDGRERTLTSLGPGQSLGELSLLDAGGSRMVSVVAQEESRLLELRHADFARLQTQKPQACLKLMRNVTAAFGARMAGSRSMLRSLLVPAARS